MAMFQGESKAELKKKYQQALEASDTEWLNPAKYLYRNKEKKYFDDIKNNHNGIMKPILNPGYRCPRNPIDGKLAGLFFSSNVRNDTLEPPLKSPLGSSRFQVPLSYLLQEGKEYFNFYFADYTLGKESQHFVILVICKEGEEADKVCKENLITLPEKNPFFVVNDDLTFKVSRRIWVHIYFTREVNTLEAINTGGGSMTESS